MLRRRLPLVSRITKGRIAKGRAAYALERRGCALFALTPVLARLACGVLALFGNGISGAYVSPPHLPDFHC
jgi:hypothetical protein